ncbi:hypothetical protein GJ496_007970 [Pomphorhynchus laevis]|nr:hypothetical protein GJ496_007970 [Pomphorhynchus laevis]
MLLDEDRIKVIEDMEERSHNLSELCYSVISDLKSSGPVWDDFISKANKLHGQTRNFVVSFGAFVDSFQRIADIATKSSGNLSETKEIGATLTRMCLRQRSVESKLKSMDKSFNENILCKLNQEIDDWHKNVNNLDKEYNKSMREYRKRRSELRKKTTANLKLHNKFIQHDNRRRNTGGHDKPLLSCSSSLSLSSSYKSIKLLRQTEVLHKF